LNYSCHWWVTHYIMQGCGGYPKALTILIAIPL
jgi:hypothetical protein